MLGGGRFKKTKKNPKTTNLQLWRQNGNGMWTGRRMIVFNKKKKKRDWIFLYKHKGQFVKERERHTLLEGNFGFLLFKLAKQMELAQYHAADPFLIFFSFFSLFLCCGQDRWQARTIFRGPLVLIVQCSYWNLYTRQSRILGVQKKKV